MAAVVPILIAAGSLGGSPRCRYSGGYGYIPPKKRGRGRLVMWMALVLWALALSVFIVVMYEPRTSEIVRGYPVRVLEVQSQHYKYIKYYGPKVYELSLVTKRVDCPTCKEEKHRKISADTWRAYPPGSLIRWSDQEYNSTVVRRSYRRNSYYGDGYVFRFKVQQCLPENTFCTIGWVKVNVQTWLNTEVGDVITFNGKPGQKLPYAW